MTNVRKYLRSNYAYLSAIRSASVVAKETPYIWPADLRLICGSLLLYIIHYKVTLIQAAWARRNLGWSNEILSCMPRDMRNQRC
jgi:hypothetical protein